MDCSRAGREVGAATAEHTRVCKTNRLPGVQLPGVPILRKEIPQYNILSETLCRNAEGFVVLWEENIFVGGFLWVKKLMI